MTRLARRGHRVLYVDRQSIAAGGSRRDTLRSLAPALSGYGLREVEAGLYVYTHQHAPLLGWRWNERRKAAILRPYWRCLGFDAPVAIAFYPDAAPLMSTLKPRLQVYYAVHDLSAFGERPESERQQIRAREAELLRRTGVAFGVSPRLVARFRQFQPNTHLLENGVDFLHFSPERLARISGHPAITSLPGPRLGQIDERIDQPLVRTLARGRRHRARDAADRGSGLSRHRLLHGARARGARLFRTAGAAHGRLAAPAPGAGPVGWLCARSAGSRA